MGIFKKLAKAVIDTALTPVEVVRDVAEGEVPFTARSRSGQRFDDVRMAVEDAYDELDED